MSLRLNPKPYNREPKGGFSLVELLVSVAIVTVITTVVLVKHSQFSGNILIENLAYDVALSIRQAQVFGLSVREFGVGSGTFDIGYGVHFDSGVNDSYILFADRNRNSVYDGSQEIVEVFTLRRGNTIAQLCGVLPNRTEKCSPGGIAYLDIVFERPDPDAIIKSDVAADTYTTARITVRSPRGVERNVVVIFTGQISVPQR